MKNYTIGKCYLLFALLVALAVKVGVRHQEITRDRATGTKEVAQVPIPVQYAQIPTVQEADTVVAADSNEPLPDQPSGIWAFLVANWVALLIALGGFLEVIVRLTPSQKDDTILAFIKNILDSFIPNRRIGGGTH